MFVRQPNWMGRRPVGKNGLSSTSDYMINSSIIFWRPSTWNHNQSSKMASFYILINWTNRRPMMSDGMIWFMLTSSSIKYKMNSVGEVYTNPFRWDWFGSIYLGQRTVSFLEGQTNMRLYSKSVRRLCVIYVRMMPIRHSYRYVWFGCNSLRGYSMFLLWCANLVS